MPRLQQGPAANAHRLWTLKEEAFRPLSSGLPVTWTPMLRFDSSQALPTTLLRQMGMLMPTPSDAAAVGQETTVMATSETVISFAPSRMELWVKGTWAKAKTSGTNAHDLLRRFQDLANTACLHLRHPSWN